MSVGGAEGDGPEITVGAGYSYQCIRSASKNKEDRKERGLITPSGESVLILLTTHGTRRGVSLNIFDKIDS